MSFVTVKKIKVAKSIQPFIVGFEIILGIFFGSQAIKSDIRDNKILWGVFFVVSVLLLIKSVKKLLLLKNLFKIDAVLASSEKKEVSLFYICESVGMSEKKLTRLVKKLIKKNYLHSCSLDAEGESKILLQIQTEENLTELTLECPSCGKVFTTEACAVVRCPECASIINI